MATMDPCELMSTAEEQVLNDEERTLLAGYRAMAADREREEEAMEWSEALIGDSAEAR